jgi:hypothetical protein
MTLTHAISPFNWFAHDEADCPSLAGFCDHCLICGVVVERYTGAGAATCEEHYREVSRQCNT